ncbi:type II toxin-antitoxin system HicA family toxin [Marinobacter changyiensis]|uniref:type II toxin-antitoxin system HicA family toxin n=1 Tax=Marinobacter changyiensis TaxID=2604091 RepID=UPI001263EDC1
MKRFSSNKDWNVVIRRLVKLGWRYRRGGKHGRLTHPDCSRTLIIPVSPSDHRSLQNFMRTVRSTRVTQA